MTHLFGCICNQAQSLTEALEPVRSVLVARPPIDRWGFGYVQSGEVLLSRRPRVARDETVDFFSALHRQRTDYAIVCASPPDGLSGQDNTQPFRFRKWLFAQDGVLPAFGAIQQRLLEHVPAYLRRNIQGRTSAEHVFHIFLSMLHDAGAIDDPDLDPAVAVRALRDTGVFVSALIQQAGTPQAQTSSDGALASGPNGPGLAAPEGAGHGSPGSNTPGSSSAGYGSAAPAVTAPAAGAGATEPGQGTIPQVPFSGNTRAGWGNIIATNARIFLAARMDEPLFIRWVKIPGRSAGTELRAVIAVSRTGCGDEPPGEGFEALPRRTVLVVARDVSARIVQLDF